MEGLFLKENAMKNLSLLLMLMSLVPFSACNIGQTAQEDITEQVLLSENKTNSEMSSAVPETSEKVSTVSSFATEEFLLPFDDYSWEREFPIEKVIVHFMSAVVNYPEDPYSMNLLRNIFVDSGLSVHYIIARDGTVYCYMPESRAAWHAGKGTFGDDEKYTNSMNKYSVGIELVAIGSEQDMAQYLHPDEYKAIDESLIGFTDEQYASLTALIKDICQRNKIEFSRENVIGHDEYNEAKSDPGELFDWERVFG